MKFEIGDTIKFLAEPCIIVGEPNENNKDYKYRKHEKGTRIYGKINTCHMKHLEKHATLMHKANQGQFD